MKALYPILIVMGGVLVLTRLPGCTSTDEKALHDWVVGQRQQLSASAAAAPAPQPIVLANYVQTTKLDPFDARRLAGAPETGQKPPLAWTEASPESVESYPLSTLRMVGSLRKEGAVVALIQAGARVYQVLVGARIGTGRAEVLQVSETGVIVREGAAHMVTLQLQGR